MQLSAKVLVSIPRAKVQRRSMSWKQKTGVSVCLISQRESISQINTFCQVITYIKVKKEKSMGKGVLEYIWQIYTQYIYSAILPLSNYPREIVSIFISKPVHGMVIQLSGTLPGWQVQGPEFGSQYSKNKNKIQKTNKQKTHTHMFIRSSVCNCPHLETTLIFWGDV